MTAQPTEIARVNVLGVGISALNLNSAVEALLTAAKKKLKGYVCVTGVHGVSEAQRDLELREILNGSFLNTPDGMPMVWMGRLQGFKTMDRVYGPDLMLLLCQVSVQHGLSHFFYGGGPGIAEELAKRMEKRFPGLLVAGTYTPPFKPLSEHEMRALQTTVAHAKPDFFWVGLSTPKQEKFMAAFYRQLEASVFLGVGAAFDFHAGKVRQAPRWMQRGGLEWFFRLCSEPRRLWKRYLKNNPVFVWRAFCQLTGLKKYKME